MSADGAEVNQGELGTRLGLTTRQIRNLEEAGLTARPDGKEKWYAWPASLHWYVQYREERSSRTRASETFQEWELREIAAKVRLAEVRAAEAEQRVIPLDVHEERLTTVADRLATRCKGLGRYVADVQRATTALEASALLDQISDDLLRTLTTVADDLAAEAAASDEPAAADEAPATDVPA